MRGILVSETAPSETQQLPLYFSTLEARVPASLLHPKLDVLLQTLPGLAYQTGRTPQNLFLYSVMLYAVLYQIS